MKMSKQQAGERGESGRSLAEMLVVMAIVGAVIPASVWALRNTIIGVTNWRRSLDNSQKIRCASVALSRDAHRARSAEVEEGKLELTMHEGGEIAYYLEDKRLMRKGSAGGGAFAPAQTVSTGIDGVSFFVSSGARGRLVRCVFNISMAEEPMPCCFSLVLGGEPWK